MDEVIDNEVCTFDYAVEDREATASSFGVDFALRFLALSGTTTKVALLNLIFSFWYFKIPLGHNHHFLLVGAGLEWKISSDTLRSNSQTTY